MSSIGDSLPDYEAVGELGPPPLYINTESAADYRYPPSYFINTIRIWIILLFVNPRVCLAV